jgi:predicted anti-sigma-YlaC factor YlaD
MFRPSACDRFRPTLLDFVDRRERGPATDAALDHLGWCEGCRRELTETALAIAALRRVGSELRAVPVPAMPSDGLARLVAGHRDPWRWRMQLGSLVASAAIAAVVVAPHVGLGPSGPSARQLTAPRTAVSIVWHAEEARIEASPDWPSYAAAVALPSRYPDSVLTPWKEVFLTDATPRGFTPS